MNSRTIWDYWAPRYEKLLVQRFSVRPAHRLVLQHMDRACPTARRILDIGCGVGQLAHEIAAKRPEARMIAADTSSAMISRARAEYSAPNITYLQGSLEEIPREDGFDVIVSTHSFPYFQDKLKAACLMYGLLRAQGRVLIVQGNSNNLYDALWLFFVKFTTTKAEYSSVAKLRAYLESAGCKIGAVRSIDKYFFIPSIYMVEGIKC